MFFGFAKFAGGCNCDSHIKDPWGQVFQLTLIKKKKNKNIRRITPKSRKSRKSRTKITKIYHD
jgi:hypothetical protein